MAIAAITSGSQDGRGSEAAIGGRAAMREERVARGSTWKAGEAGGDTSGCGGNLSLLPFPDCARGVPRLIQLVANG